MKYRIRKVTHKWFIAGQPLAVCIGQDRGGRLWLNRLDSACQIAEVTSAVESAARHLTGYGKGVAPGDAQAVAAMQSAWRFVFGEAWPAPDYCERHNG